jgi:FkbH-like protein/thioester reductase-like protein
VLRNVQSGEPLSKPLKFDASGRDLELDLVMTIPDTLQNKQSAYKSTHKATNDQSRIALLSGQTKGLDLAFNLGGMFSITGTYDHSTSKDIIDGILQRHDSYRSVFERTHEGVFRHVLPRSRITFSVPYYDFSTCQVPFDQIKDIYKQNLNTPFNIFAQPPFLCAVCKVSANKHIFVLTLHHIIADFRSTVLFGLEFRHFYELKTSKHPGEFPFLMTGDTQAYTALEEKGLENYSQRKNTLLASVNEYKNIDFGKDIPLLKRCMKLTHRAHEIPAQLVEEVSNKAKSLGVSTTTLYTAAAQLFVNAISGQDKFVMGLPVDIRPGKMHKGAMGYLSRPMFIRFDAGDHTSLSGLLKDVSKQIKTALKYRFFPIGDLYTDVSTQGVRPPRIQVLFNHLRAVDLNSQHHEMHVEAVYGEFTHSDMDMWITVQERESTAAVKIEYSQDIFSEAVADESSSRFLEMLDVICGGDDDSLESIVVSTEDIQEDAQDLSVNVIGSFTLDPLKKTLFSISQRMKISVDAYLYPYQQVIQSLILPEDHKRQGGLNVLLRLEDFFRDKDFSDIKEPDIEKVITDISDAVSISVSNKSVYHQVILCPSTSTSPNPYWVEANKLLQTNLSKLPSVTVVNLEGDYDQNQFDVDAEKIAHIPYKTSLYRDLSRKMLAFSYCQSTVAPKVFVLDCDNTLWKGIVGEEGINGIEITEAHRRFQEKLVSIQERGGLLALASKNNENEVLQVFNDRKDMPLSMNHLVSYKINWNDKSSNIRELADEMNLGLDAFVFFDDNPVEIERMHFSLPEVLSIKVPTETKALSAWLENLWVFGHTFSSDFDRTRVYREEVSRKESRFQHSDIEAFIQDLKLETFLSSVDDNNINRASQLTLRTNQFNLTGERLSELQLCELLEGDEYEGYVISCQDRFGDYGIIGFILLSIQDNTLIVRNLLVSCRVLGRGVEVHILKHIHAICRAKSFVTVSFKYNDTGRNIPGREFLTSIGHSLKMDSSAGLQDIPVEQLLDIKISSFFRNNEQGKDIKKSTVNVDRKKESEFLLAACSLDNNETTNNHGLVDASVTSRLELLWRESLESQSPEGQPPSSYDDFFESGGDSLAAVGLLIRINQAFGLDLSIGEIYENSIFTELLSLISARTTDDTQRTGNTAYQEILRDIELSYDDMPLLEGWQNIAKSTSHNTLLSGATGYVGIHLLKQLLQERHTRVTCLIRGTNVAKAKVRLKSAANQYQLSLCADEMARIDILNGDLEKPLLGLDVETWHSLQDSLTRVVHCGANVNFFESYNRLKQANVESTRELIKLCTGRIHKKLIYISSVGVLHGTNHIQLNEFAETVATGTPVGIPTGYQQSKWASEKLIYRAVERGLNAQIVRLGTIAGNTVTRSLNQSDLLTHLLATIRRTGFSPQMRDMDFVPVDFAAKAISCIVRQSHNAGEVFHIANPYTASISQVSQWARFNGNQLEVMAFNQWREKMLALFKQSPEEPLSRYEPLFYEIEQQASFIEILLTAPPVRTHNTRKFLESHNLTFPAITPELFLELDEVFKENGLLDRDTIQGADNKNSLFHTSESMSGFISESQGITCDDDYRAAYEIGLENNITIKTNLILHVDNYAELFNKKKVCVTGEIHCPEFNKDPLVVKNGHFEVAPFGGYRPKQKDSLLFLVYHLELISTLGDIYTLKGMKINRSIENVFFEVSRLLITIERKGDTGNTMLAGIVEAPFAELFRSQLADMRFRPHLDEKRKMKSKMMWIMFLTIPFVKNHLNLFLRRNIWSWADIKEDIEIIPFLREKRKALSKSKTIFNRLGFLSGLFKD